MMEPVAHIVIKPNGNRSVTLATQYDPMASSFWLHGERPEGYNVEPLVRLSDAEARIAELQEENGSLRLSAQASADWATQAIADMKAAEARANAAEVLLKEAGKALEPLVAAWDKYQASDANMEQAYYLLAKYRYADWEAARSLASKIGVKDE